MKSFTAQTHYCKANIQKLANVVCYAHDKVTPPVIRFFGIAMVAAGFYRMIQNGDGMPVIIIGILITTNADVRGRSLGKKMCKVMEDWWPVMEFRFEDDGIHSKTDRDQMITKYKDVTRLVEEKGYFYVFTAPFTAFMIDTSTLSPKDFDGFRLFLMKKTNLDWSTPNAQGLSFQSLILRKKNKELRSKL